MCACFSTAVQKSVIVCTNSQCKLNVFCLYLALYLSVTQRMKCTRFLLLCFFFYRYAKIPYIVTSFCIDSPIVFRFSGLRSNCCSCKYCIHNFSFLLCAQCHSNEMKILFSVFFFNFRYSVFSASIFTSFFFIILIVNSCEIAVRHITNEQKKIKIMGFFKSVIV